MLGRIEQFFFYLLVFCIPIQARLILHQWTWPFNEWTAGFLYGTDILLGVVFLLWLVRVVRRPAPLRLEVSGRLVVAFFALAALSILSAHLYGLAFYRLLKLGEFILLYFYVRSRRDVVNYYQLAWTVLAAGLFQSLIAIGQYWRQGSLGLRWLGESVLSVDTTNVAVLVANGAKYLRVYGTTPHPNVLAAWLVIALAGFYYLYQHQFSIRNGRSGLRIGGWVMYGVLLVGLFLTFSRVMIGLWGLGFLAMIIFGRSSKNNRLLLVTAGVAILFSLFFWPQVSARVHISGEEEAVTQRLYYNSIAAKTLGNNLWLGVGLGQSIPDLMSKYRHYPSIFYQPVHNIYLLVASETGMVGLGLLLAFIFSVFWSGRRYPFFTILFSLILLAGLFDHYLWSLQPGGLLFWVVLGLPGVDS